ncbi:MULTISPECIES: ExeA family protein [unclassified Duganella]|uniref:ExeA family protein n=1 Tax=unclassified Duganella TaxID=2636909 RepID=UPI0006F6F653|nr:MULTISPECIES: ExeA family protein [unclassified Duganella]KQV45385.1 peptidoglycan-binding protein [Duganella sp. Root336D2]KRB93642.1 peptidoglycan-binding protein [Duganella sp. Root198D2]
MYTQYFNLKQQPFSIAPDPRYLFMSERHREALAHLLYGVGSGGGFVLLTGEIGAGKTTVCRCFMEQIPADCRLAYIFNPKLTVEELLQSVCDEFGVAPEGASVKSYVDAVNSYLLESHAAGHNNVLVIDEAQNLSADVLEQLRLLTNLETSERKLLQIILIGQPELRQMLARPELEQLAQRVIARYHLGPLSEAEVGSYIQHRLAVAGAGAVELFPRGLLRRIHQLSKGVPRRINLLCDRALLGTYVENRAQVNATILRRAAQEVFAGESAPIKSRAWRVAAAGVLTGAALTAAAAWQMMPAVRTPAASGLAAAPPAAARSAQATGRISQAAAAPAASAAAAPQTMASAAPQAAAAPAMPTAAQAAAPAWLTMDAALIQLAEKWEVALPEGEGCAEAAKRNLRCMQTKGGLEEIRKLDRPVIIKLRDGQAVPRNVLLTALDDKSATLVGTRGSEKVPLDALDARFDGSFTTFWRVPRSWREEVSEGDKGPDVDWLARRLAQVNGVKKPRENQPLSGETLRYLREFQLAQGLKADGVAGPRTFIRLSQPGRETEPHLLAEAGK